MVNDILGANHKYAGLTLQSDEAKTLLTSTDTKFSSACGGDLLITCIQRHIAEETENDSETTPAVLLSLFLNSQAMFT